MLKKNNWLKIEEDNCRFGMTDYFKKNIKRVMIIILLEVIGVEPPCARCAATQKNALDASEMLKKKGIDIDVKKLNITSKDVISKYGVILSPALAINNQIRVAGRIPNPDEIVKIIKETIAAGDNKI